MFNSFCSEHNKTTISFELDQEKLSHFRFHRPKNTLNNQSSKRKEKMLLKRKRWAWCCNMSESVFAFVSFQIITSLTPVSFLSDLQLSRTRKNGKFKIFAWVFCFVHMELIRSLHAFFQAWVWSNHKGFAYWLKCTKYSLKYFFQLSFL